MTEYHHEINGQAYHLFKHSSLWEERSEINPVTCLSLYDAFDVFQGFIFTPYQRH